MSEHRSLGSTSRIRVHAVQSGRHRTTLKCGDAACLPDLHPTVVGRLYNTGWL
jgi:hypothetical protein